MFTKYAAYKLGMYYLPTGSEENIQEHLPSAAYHEVPEKLKKSPRTTGTIRVGRSYREAALLGALAGGAGGVLSKAVLRTPLATSAAMGTALGTAGGLVRAFDSRSDPPGLSPIYGVPAGANLGGLIGAVGGAAIGGHTNVGLLKGLALGGATGALGGVAGSTFLENTW